MEMVKSIINIFSPGIRVVCTHTETIIKINNKTGERCDTLSMYNGGE